MRIQPSNQFIQITECSKPNISLSCQDKQLSQQKELDNLDKLTSIVN